MKENNLLENKQRCSLSTCVYAQLVLGADTTTLHSADSRKTPTPQWGAPQQSDTPHAPLESGVSVPIEEGIRPPNSDFRFSISDF